MRMVAAAMTASRAARARRACRAATATMSSTALLDGAGGADRLLGGSGQDTASYAARARGVTVTVGAGADDGEPREGDDVAADVERVVGGRGADSLVARAGVDSILQGGDGDDLLRLRDARSSLDSSLDSSVSSARFSTGEVEAASGRAAPVHEHGPAGGVREP